MARASLLGPLQSEVLECLRRRGPSTVAEVADELNATRPAHPLAYRTVLTVLGRLEAKGVLGHERQGRAYRYRVVLSDEEFVAAKAAEAVQVLLARFGDAAVAGFAGEVIADPRRRALLEELLDGDDERTEA